MRNIFFIALFFVGVSESVAQFNEIKILGITTIEKDYYVEGAKGINITYKYNFLSLEEQHHEDTILRGATFYLTTQILEDGMAVTPSKGYASSSDVLEFQIPLTGVQIEASKFSKTVVQFVPYASLNMSEGSHNIQVYTTVTGKDASGKQWRDSDTSGRISIVKPANKLFHLDIDYIELNTLNAKGNAWDYSIFKTDAPDVGVSVMIGNTVLWESQVNDTYMFSVGPNSRNIEFAISEGDKVGILIQDIDVMYHDFVAKWLFSTNDKKIGTGYTYDKSKGNIKSCNLKFSFQ
ncbi:MAG: hypothetical protein K1X55_00285 [Chitinophagales bacterium]|nr:hypothetical protein [Chitinophagales bacterium]